MPAEVPTWLSDLLAQISPAERIGIAFGLTVFVLILAGRAVVLAVLRARRRGWRPRLRALRRRYGLEKGEGGKPDKTVSAENPTSQASSLLLSRAELPVTRLGRVRHTITRRVQVAGGRRAAAWVGMAAAVAFGGALLALSPIVGSLAGAAVGVVAAVFAGDRALRFGENRQSARFLENFPEAIDMIVRAVRAGLPVSAAIRTASDDLPDPVGTEFRRISDELAIGTSFDVALANAADRVRLRDFRFFVVTLALQNETGGRLTETLENLSGILRARADLREKVRALTSDGRTSANVIAAMPVVALGALFLISPGMMDRFITDPTGQLLAAIALGLIVTGVAVVRRMVRIEA